jgi:hypothetical protein
MPYFRIRLRVKSHFGTILVQIFKERLTAGRLHRRQDERIIQKQIKDRLLKEKQKDVQF